MQRFTERLAPLKPYLTRRNAMNVIMLLAFSTPLISFATTASRNPERAFVDIIISHWWLLLAPIAIIIWFAFRNGVDHDG